MSRVSKSCLFTWLRFLCGSNLSARQFEPEYVGIVNDALECFVPRRQKSGIIPERFGYQKAESFEERQQFFYVFLRVLSDNVS